MSDKAYLTRRATNGITFEPTMIAYKVSLTKAEARAFNHYDQGRLLFNLATTTAVHRPHVSSNGESIHFELPIDADISIVREGIATMIRNAIDSARAYEAKWEPELK